MLLSFPLLHSLFLRDILQLVRGSEHLLRPPAHVVVEPLRDDGARGDEVVVPVENEAHPGKLIGAGLTLFSMKYYFLLNTANTIFFFHSDCYLFDSGLKFLCPHCRPLLNWP